MGIGENFLTIIKNFSPNQLINAKAYQIDTRKFGLIVFH